jgi:hypothetical protein
MYTRKISFLSVVDKYIQYSEAATQFYQMDKANRDIIAPYIEILKKAWQTELKAIRLQCRIPEDVKILSAPG